MLRSPSTLQGTFLMQVRFCCSCYSAAIVLLKRASWPLRQTHSWQSCVVVLVGVALAACALATCAFTAAATAARVVCALTATAPAATGGQLVVAGACPLAAGAGAFCNVAFTRRRDACPCLQAHLPSVCWPQRWRRCQVLAALYDAPRAPRRRAALCCVRTCSHCE